MTQAKDTEWFRTLVITEVEEEVLVTMAKFFMDNGWIQQETEAGFDTLIEKICEPAPWDYSIDPQSIK